MKPITNFVILGAASDVTSRLVLPGIASLLNAEPDRTITVIGTSRHDNLDMADMMRQAATHVGAQGPAVDKAINTATHSRVDATNANDILTVLSTHDGPSALYFALPPAVTLKALTALADTGVPDGTILALEKPIGDDVQSAHRINELVHQIVPTTSVFRIDHFLGLPALRNLLGFRFANRFLEPLLSRDHVDRIDITFDEELGLEGRAEFYDSTGALADMIQSHLLQLLGVVMMEPPASFDEVEIPALIAHVLRSTHVWDDDARPMPPVRGRYSAGRVGGRELPAYADEKGVDPARNTETFAQVTVEVDTWRWNGVPVTLRSGKAIGSARQDICITFKRPPHRYHQFPRDGLVPPATLRFGVMDEHITMDVNVGGPFDSRGMSRVSLSSGMPEPGVTAYGSVVRGILDRDPTFAVRADSSQEAWRIIADVHAEWEHRHVPLVDYPAGSEGPQ